MSKFTSEVLLFACKSFIFKNACVKIFLIYYKKQETRKPETVNLFINPAITYPISSKFFTFSFWEICFCRVRCNIIWLYGMICQKFLNICCIWSLKITMLEINSSSSTFVWICCFHCFE